MYGHTLACMDLSWENLSNKYEQIWDTYTFVHTFIKKHQRNNFIPVQRVFWCLLCKYYVLQIYFAQPTRAMQMYSFQAFKDSDNLRSLSIRSHIFGPINKHGFSIKPDEIYLQRCCNESFRRILYRSDNLLGCGGQNSGILSKLTFSVSPNPCENHTEALKI